MKHLDTKKTSTFFVLLLSLLLSSNLNATTGSIFMHDPSGVVRCGDVYWTFSTGGGAYYSTDMQKWSSGQNPVNNFTPRLSDPTSWVQSYLPGFGGGIWAPQPFFMNGKYYFYYSCSMNGSTGNGAATGQETAIGVATNPTLDPASPNYKWTDLGMVVSSKKQSEDYAIDPGIFRDKITGQIWMVYGSYPAGNLNVGVVELDSVTGKKKNSNPRSVVSYRGEAAFIIQHEDYYYLLVNRGSCCSGVSSGYTVYVGRSKSPTGPYVDKNNVDMVNYGGSIFLQNKDGRYIGPGCTGYYEESGNEWLTYHFYDGNNNGSATLAVSLLTWDANGWPISTRTDQKLQRVSFNTIGPKVLSEKQFIMTASASSGLPVTFSSSDSTVIRVNGSVAELVGDGECILSASQAGDASWVPIKGMQQRIKVRDLSNATKLTWVGAVNSNVDSTANNWLDSKGLQVRFEKHDTLVFNETGKLNNQLNLVNKLEASNWIFETATGSSYTIGGLGSLTGIGGILKSGPGTLSIANKTNTHSGATSISGGTLELFDLTNKGLSGPLGKTDGDPSKWILSNSKLKYSGTKTDVTTDRGITLIGSDTIFVDAGKTFGIKGDRRGSGKIIKTGAGNLNLGYMTNAITGSGNLELTEGKVWFDSFYPSGDALALGTGPITFRNGELAFYNNYPDVSNSFPQSLYVPESYTGQLSMKQQFSLNGAVTGSGTLTINQLYGSIERSQLQGSWADFGGTIRITAFQLNGSFNTSGTTRLCGANNKAEKATLYLGDYCGLRYSIGTNNTVAPDLLSSIVKIGALEGKILSKLLDEQWEIGAKNINSTYSGFIGGLPGTSITKVGTGKLTLNGKISTYAGGTFVKGGILEVNNSAGSGTGTGTVIVDSLGILSGKGYIAGAVTIKNGGLLAPGSVDLGSLKLNGGLTLQPGSTTRIRIDAAKNDTLTVSGTSVLNGTLELQVVSGNLQAGTSIKVLNLAGSTGAFTAIKPMEPGVGLVWDTTELLTAGVLKVNTSTAVSIISDGEVKVYPNPTKGIIVAILPKSSGKVFLEIIDMDGKNCVGKKWLVSGLNTIDMTSFKKGIYLFRFSLNDVIIVKKVVKK